MTDTPDIRRDAAQEAEIARLTAEQIAELDRLEREAPEGIVLAWWGPPTTSQLFYAACRRHMRALLDEREALRAERDEWKRNATERVVCVGCETARSEGYAEGVEAARVLWVRGEGHKIRALRAPSPAAGALRCEACGGSGVTLRDFANASVEEFCTDCGGTGRSTTGGDK